MGFGVAAVVPDRQARPEWDPAAPEERTPIAAERLMPVLRSHTVAISLLDGLQAVAARGGEVIVVRHSGNAPVQILMDGRRFPLPLGAGHP